MSVNTKEAVVKRQSRDLETEEGLSTTWVESIANDLDLACALLFRNMVPLGLSPSAVIIIMQILYSLADDDLPYPTQARLSELMGLSARHIRTILRKLVDQGYLKIVSGRKHGAPNQYDFRPLFGVLSEFVEDEDDDLDEYEDDDLELDDDEDDDDLDEDKTEGGDDCCPEPALDPVQFLHIWRDEKREC